MPKATSSKYLAGPPSSDDGAPLAEADERADLETIDNFLSKNGSSDAATKLQSGHRGKTARKKVNEAQAQRAIEIAEQREAASLEIFAKHDVDNDGSLSFKEMAKALRDMCTEAGVAVKPDMAMLEKKFDEADTDKNGMLP